MTNALVQASRREVAKSAPSKAEIQEIIDAIEGSLTLRSKFQRSAWVIGDMIVKACGTVILPQVGAPTLNKKNLKIVYEAIAKRDLDKEGYNEKALYEFGMMSLKFPEDTRQKGMSYSMHKVCETPDMMNKVRAALPSHVRPDPRGVGNVTKLVRAIKKKPHSIPSPIVGLLLTVESNLDISKRLVRKSSSILENWIDKLDQDAIDSLVESLQVLINTAQDLSNKVQRVKKTKRAYLTVA